MTSTAPSSTDPATSGARGPTGMADMDIDKTDATADLSNSQKRSRTLDSWVGLTSLGKTRNRTPRTPAEGL